jgi:ribosomal protein S18 acetylase RimI-like enzyme
LKAWQINYLKNLQAADLERRRDRSPDTNEMFLAYEIRDATGTDAALSQPLLMDDELEGAFNLGGGGGSSSNTNSNCYVRGDLLGFVEITQRSYGLGGTSVESPSLLEGLASATSGRKMRPVLTNLAVSKESRKYGIGSRLLEACEDHAYADWKMAEMILEVEDYNDEGLEFYRRRGYEIIFSDPASRRYDIQGFWLNKVRCRRDIMRKPLDGISRRNNRRLLLGSGSPTAGSLADGLLRRIRDTVGNF